jgi:hypothetical protein
LQTRRGGPRLAQMHIHPWNDVRTSAMPEK